MPYINRDTDGYITEQYSTGIQYEGQEYLTEDSEEWLAFINGSGKYILESKKKLLSDINLWREQARLTEGANYKNDIFDIDAKSQANITALVGLLVANNVPDLYETVYRSKTNKDHNLIKSEMVQLGTVIGAKVSEIYQKSWTLKEQVDNATTKEELEAITW